jgi:hypothetical protein
MQAICCPVLQDIITGALTTNSHGYKHQCKYSYNVAIWIPELCAAYAVARKLRNNISWLPVPIATVTYMMAMMVSNEGATDCPFLPHIHKG